MRPVGVCDKSTTRGSVRRVDDDPWGCATSRRRRVVVCDESTTTRGGVRRVADDVWSSRRAISGTGLEIWKRGDRLTWIPRSFPPVTKQFCQTAAK